MTIEALFTSGVYGKNADEFFQSVIDSKINLLIDVRHRRGMRGAEYAFANSKRLQRRLKELGIRCLHAKYLAPTVEIRRIQKSCDKVERVAKRQRTAVNNTFVEAYRREILTEENLQKCLEDIGKIMEASPLEPLRVCLLCVERDPQACHRSLIGEELSRLTGLTARHL